MRRAFFDIALFLSLFILPWWITAILALIGMFLFKRFYEFLVVSIVFYSLFGYQSGRIIASPLWYPLIVCTVFMSIEYIKKNMILYKNEI